MLGSHSPTSAASIQLVRSPLKDPDAQRAMLQRFLGPPYNTDC
jgi:hypothetical protein